MSISPPIGTAPAAGYWRYDALVIGTDGVIDTVAGTPFNVRLGAGGGKNRRTLSRNTGKPCADRRGVGGGRGDGHHAGQCQ